MESLLQKKKSPLLFFFFLISAILVSTSATLEDDKLSAYDVLKSYEFPAGLLPQGVTGYELDPSTGKFAAYLPGSCSFSIQGYKLTYKSTISGFISKRRLTKLKGVTVKFLLFNVNIIEVTSNDGDLGFSVGIASADFPVDNFDESPQCGCGFDCNHLRASPSSSAAALSSS